ncbi:MAG: nucleotide exchange factor GrpE [Solirubrobacteraceae bacterium]
MQETTSIPEIKSPASSNPDGEAQPTAVVAPAVQPPDGLTELAAEVRALSGRLEALAKQLQRQQDVVHRLHEENQRLRLGEVQEAVAPLARDLIDLIDRSARIRASAENGDARDLQVIESGILQALRRNGVERREVHAGTSFDPATQLAVSVLDTHHAALHERIAEVLKQPYVRTSDRRLLREAEVAVYRFAPERLASPCELEGING